MATIIAMTIPAIAPPDNPSLAFSLVGGLGEGRLVVVTTGSSLVRATSSGEVVGVGTGATSRDGSGMIITKRKRFSVRLVCVFVICMSTYVHIALLSSS